MNFNVTCDWKFVVALGSTVVMTVFAVKMDSDAVERVSTHAVDSLGMLVGSRLVNR